MSSTSATYEAKKARERKRQAEIARTGADVGKIPRCKNSRRRAAGEKSLRVFCEKYFKARFPLKWAPHHLHELEHIERVIRHGGKQAIGDPRGDGKTTRLEIGVLWAILYGYQTYVALLTAVGKHASKRITSLKVALQTNDILAEDFPDVCLPIRKMGGIANRAASMHVGGKPVWPSADSVWSKTRIVLPTVEGSKCSGAIAEAAGLLEATRGLNAARSDGSIVRPGLVLADDPQTDKSAKSELQCEEREQALAAGIMNLSGPDERMSALVALTVIRPGDMADRLLDRELHPEYHGIRNKMLVTFPTRMALWDEYADIYRDELAAGSETFPRSTRFYRGNRKAMDDGAKVTWEQRREDASSAIELAMRKFIEDRRSFYSEMQNEPESDTADDTVEILTSEQICKKVSGYRRHELPPQTERLTFFVDVHKELMYYCVCAWWSDFTGQVIDYGTWPDQAATYFDLRHIRKTISGDIRITASTVEGQVEQALDQLFSELSSRVWKASNGAEYGLAMGMCDANWGPTTDQVYSACRQAQRKYGLTVLPSHGMSFGPNKCPIDRWDKKKIKGKSGDHWHIPPPKNSRGIRHVLFDAGRRKSFMHRRLATPAGDPGSLSLFHGPETRHRCFADHLTAEVGRNESGQYGELTMWKLLPGRDNHWLDCLSGCVTAESILGGQLRTLLHGSEPTNKPKMKLSELRRKKAMQR